MNQTQLRFVYQQKLFKCNWDRVFKKRLVSASIEIVREQLTYLLCVFDYKVL